VDVEHDGQVVALAGVLGREDVEVEAVLAPERGRLNAGHRERRGIVDAGPGRGGCGGGEALGRVSEGDAKEGAGDAVLDEALDRPGLGVDNELWWLVVLMVLLGLGAL
jgi:hypothetical protein